MKVILENGGNVKKKILFVLAAAVLVAVFVSALLPDTADAGTQTWYWKITTSVYGKGLVEPRGYPYVIVQWKDQNGRWHRTYPAGRLKGCGYWRFAALIPSEAVAVFWTADIYGDARCATTCYIPVGRSAFTLTTYVNKYTTSYYAYSYVGFNEGPCY